MWRLYDMRDRFCVGIVVLTVVVAAMVAITVCSIGDGRRKPSTYQRTLERVDEELRGHVPSER
jgi:hypothetical protein